MASMRAVARPLWAPRQEMTQRMRIDSFVVGQTSSPLTTASSRQALPPVRAPDSYLWFGLGASTRCWPTVPRRLVETCLSVALHTLRTVNSPVNPDEPASWPQELRDLASEAGPA
jgi:hypothetical protein